jgi:hypothetical protein
MTDSVVQHLADEAAIRRLTAYYSDAVTHLDAARAASVYAAGGVVEIAGHKIAGAARSRAACAKQPSRSSRFSSSSSTAGLSKSAGMRRVRVGRQSN